MWRWLANQVQIQEVLSDLIKLGWNLKRKKGNVLFNDALNTFKKLYCIGNMVKDYSDSERGNPLLLLHRLLFLINSKGSFICTIPQTG